MKIYKTCFLLFLIDNYYLMLKKSVKKNIIGAGGRMDENIQRRT
jgi:hypothetical protein